MICDASGNSFPKWNEEDKDACSVHYCMEIMQVAKEASCGKCVLCREGTWQVYKIIKDITEGKAESEDYELLLDLLEQMKEHSSCNRSRTAAFLCLELMKQYEKEWEQHIRRKLCSKLVCKGMEPISVGSFGCSSDKEDGGGRRRRRRRQ